MTQPPRLFTFEFLTLCFICFFGFCNMSVFYSFFTYLDSIGIPLEWRGVLVGLEPLSAFVLRLTVIPWLHAGNAARTMFLAFVMLIVALCSYLWAVTIPALIVVRVFHGAAFVLLVSAVMVLFVHIMPKERSAQGFGVISVMVLIPYALAPLLTEALLPFVKSAARIYAGVTVLAVPGLVLLFFLDRKVAHLLKGPESVAVRRPTLEEFKQDLKSPGILPLLVLFVLIHTAYASVFYFMKSYLTQIGVGNAGMFFTISTLMMIAVRVMGGASLDKGDRLKTLKASMLVLIACYACLGRVTSHEMLYLLAGTYGLSLGLIMPLLNSMLLLISPPQFSGLNINLALFMMDAGFWLSPHYGKMLLAAGHPHGDLFTLCAGFLSIGLVLLMLIRRVS